MKVHTRPISFGPRAVFGVASAIAAAAISGCNVGPDYSEPKLAEKDGWSESLEGGIVAKPADLRRWWATLNDPMLDSLIDRAMAGSLNLKQATARLAEARAQRGVTAADIFPTVNANGSYSRSRGSQNAVSSGGGSSPSSIGFPGREHDFYNASFDATWEIDLWGRIRRAVESADADVESAEESRRDVLVTLLSETARNYIEVRSYQQRLAIAQLNVGIQRDTLQLSTSRFQGGLTSELDVKRAESQLATTEASIPPLQAGMKQSMHRLAVLTGKEPGALVAELEACKPIPGVPTEIPIGLPADLVRRRPDVRKAERDLASATAQVGVATAELLPRFSLTGSFGFQSNQAGTWFDSPSRFWSFGPAFKWPIFDANRIRNNILVQDAKVDEALAVYEQSVLTAYEDVENALVNYSRERVRRESLSQAVNAEQRALDLAQQLYKQGLTDFLSVLDTERQLYSLQDDLVQSDRAVTADLIALYKALGGGWDADVAVAAKGEAPSAAQ